MIPPIMDFKFRGRGLGLGRKYREPDFVAAGDFETVKGKPYTFQICMENEKPLLYYLNENPKVARQIIYGLFNRLPDRGIGIIGFYFLKFDIQALFLDCPEKFTGLANMNPEFDREDGVTFQGCLTWPTCFLIMRKGNRKIFLFDLFRFFEGGLGTVCENLKLPIQKMDRPPYIGERYPKNDEINYFEQYALCDVSSAVGIVRKCLKLFERYDLGLKVSNAHLAASIFKKFYTQDETGKPVGLDKPDILQQLGALKAYHGGRNSLTVPYVPFIAENCRYYDVSSMYPFCGGKIPPGFMGKWVWDYNLNQEILENGIYICDFWIDSPIPYKLIMNAEGEYLKPGYYEEIWLAGIEIQTALKHKIMRGLKNVRGFFWESGSKFRGRHPVREYMNDFYEKKQQKTNGWSLREHYKKMLNCLYGKLISTIPTLRDNKEVHFPGSIFNAPMGCLITAWSRCLIFDSEIKYGSLHSATDSIICPGPLYPPDLENVKMGDFVREYEGDFVVGRNKLYAILENQPSKPGFTGYEKAEKTWYYQGKRIFKYALHAFQGNIIDFLLAIFENKREYISRRMGNIRESLRRPGIIPLAFNEIPMAVNFSGKYSPDPTETGEGNRSFDLKKKK